MGQILPDTSAMWVSENCSKLSFGRSDSSLYAAGTGCMRFAIKCSSSDPHSLYICSDRFPPPLHGNGHCQQEAQTSRMLLSQLSRNVTNFMCTDMQDFFFLKSLTFRKLVESVAIRKLYKNILHPFLLNHVQMQVWIPAVILWKHSLEFRTVSNYWVYDSKVPVTVLNSDVLSCIMEYNKGRFRKEIMSANIRQNKLFGNYMYHLNWMALILLYVTRSINYLKINNNIDNIYVLWILRNYMYHLNWMALILLYVTWSINYFKIYNNILTFTCFESFIMRFYAH